MPYFLKAYNALRPETCFPMDSLRAQATILAKEGKDPLLRSSYPPISLLNIDLKLFTKVLANRLLQFIPDLIHLDQVGIVPRRQYLKSHSSNSGCSVQVQVDYSDATIHRC